MSEDPILKWIREYPDSLKWDDDIGLILLSTRALNCLSRAGIGTVGAFIDADIEFELDLKGCGAKTAAELRAERLKLIGHVKPMRGGPCCQLDVRAVETERYAL